MIAALLTLMAALALPDAPIEHPERLSRVFAALAGLASDPAPVRITHLGDSHVVADLWTGPVREGLQARFGDGGRGFVLAGRPWSSYWQKRLDNGAEGRWRVDGLRGGLDDGWFGPGGCSMASADRHAAVRARVPSSENGGARHVEVHHLRQPGGGCFEVRFDDRPVGRVATAGPWVEAAFARFDLPPGGAMVSVHPIGGREVRLDGLSFGGGRGVIYDALGINGARADRLLLLDAQGFADGLRHLDPRLLIVSYGTNELFDDSLDPADYGLRLDRVLTRLRAAAPSADCLLTGPPDAHRRGRPLPLHAAVIEAQRALADAHGCAFWDARAAMGGPGSIRDWRRARLAQRDLVHLTRDGYERLGQALSTALLHAFETTRVAEPLPRPSGGGIVTP